MKSIRQQAIELIVDIMNDEMSEDFPGLIEVTDDEVRALKNEIKIILAEMQEWRKTGHLPDEKPAITWDSLTTGQRVLLVGCKSDTTTIRRYDDADRRDADALEDLGLVTVHYSTRAGIHGAREIYITEAGRELVKGKTMTDAIEKLREKHQPESALTWDDLMLAQRQMLLGCKIGIVTVKQHQDGWSTARELEAVGLVAMVGSSSAAQLAGSGAREVQLTDAGREIVKDKDMRDWFGDRNRKT